LTRFGDLVGVKLIPTTEASVVELGARPDVAVTVDGAVTGHIELKAPGKGAQTRKYKRHDAEQWKKFSNHPNLIYTDGNEWALYRTGERRGKIVRLAGDAAADGAAAIGATDAHDLELLLRDFLTWEPIVPSSPRALAEVLAPLCRLLRDDALTAVGTKDSSMYMLADDWRRYLFADADDPQFADAYAQTVTYALLLARMEGEDNLATHAVDRLEARHGLLAQVLRILSQREAREEVEVAIDLLERTIGAIDPEMMLGSGSSDPWLYFYEEFLAAYDPKLRNNRGVYYTPVQVVQAQVRLVTELLRDRFGKKLGIVDDDVVLLDPATGTGTYLLAALDEGLAAATERFGPGEAAGRASVAAANFHGFELLVGPYAVAHLRVAQRILDEGGTLPEDGTHVYLADTLESPFAPGEGKQTSLMHKKLSEENERARKIKADKRVLVCIGNPPYDRQQGPFRRRRRRADPRRLHRAGAGGRRRRTAEEPLQRLRLLLALGAVEGVRAERRRRHRQLHHGVLLPARAGVRRDAQGDARNVRRAVGHRLGRRQPRCAQERERLRDPDAGGDRDRHSHRRPER
jgi:hypothetical protein